ncbi:hypothetical protein OH76DRAFT_512261 [Lentinus brumalis]|uniref:Uncharacterized protein n=1 Tax=Lentinus brumalis TaxID=2498619 RepID=A0A371DB71_9APHY|nr:hypothetical protein OH76DRAFT_512261 [Polyporus brumalis]
MPLVVQLNFDILREIAWSSDRQTSAARIRSCRIFYQEAAKRILRDLVRLYLQHGVDTFVRSLGPQPHGRARYVRELRIGVSQLSLKGLRTLAGCIAQMNRLQTLWIHEGEELFEFCPSLGETLAGLTSLRRPRIYFAGELTCNSLKALNSDLNLCPATSQPGRRSPFSRTPYEESSGHPPRINIIPPATVSLVLKVDLRRACTLVDAAAAMVSMRGPTPAL